ncbi:AsmA-like C-terminal domain-containing protein [Candidatus Sulfurimonas baltica]|uniref:AsmA-like C-terminal domain-containing protein n=2 Tax=Candidatus Sulfurimonas baltica TaxID=2740404 RepID=A0A7S7RP98_9BACT|nr:AsmA-like C-terminal domain-containing protein [Candidatus Sulfurimonas baltica]
MFREVLKSTVYIDSWFEKIIIKKISFNDVEGSFRYIDGGNGFLSAFSPTFSLESSMFFESHMFNIKIDKFTDKKRDINASGNLILNTIGKIELAVSLNLDISSDTNLSIYAISDTEKLSYRLESSNNIKNSRYIVDMFNMNPSVKYWVYDAIEMSSLSIRSAYGWLEYDKVDETYLNLHVKATANDLKYTYDKQLEPVNTLYTDLEFKNGILYIKPQNAFSYGFFLDKSWLKIDFSKKEELLSLYLLFNGKVDKGLLSLLNRYKIRLPFIQTEGEVATNLELNINLRSAQVTAVGDFYAKKGQIDYLGLNIDVFDAHVLLNNSYITINNMLAKYKDIATSHVDMYFNARESSGILDFRVEKLSFKEKGLTLRNIPEPLHVAYSISPQNYYLTIDNSNWIFKNELLKVSSMKIPFDMEKLTAQIPITFVEVPKIATALVSGKILLKSAKANMKIDLLKLNYNNIKLGQSPASVNVFYNNGFTISSKEKITLDIDSIDYTFNNAKVNINSDNIIVNNLSLNISDKLKSKISAVYNFKKSIGNVDVHSVEFANSTLGEIFKSDKTIQLDVESKNSEIKIASKEYDLDYTMSNNEWKLRFNSLEKIAENSKALKEFGLTNGNSTIIKKENDKNIKFSVNSEYKYKILVKDNVPIKNYTVNGELQSENGKLSLTVNDSVDVSINDYITIKAESVGININEILNFISDKNSSTKSGSNLKLSLTARNSYIYFNKDRSAVSDNINLKYKNNIVTASLAHKDGNANFKFSDGNFHLYGKDFGDIFMDNLFARSKFKGGILDFAINGRPDKHNGMIFVRNTTILDYKILNNILAFVNTIPSLTTFSLPGYNNSGLAAESTYMSFVFDENIYTISDLYLKSKEIDIIGKGNASIKNNTINIDLNLKTDLGSAISKIPIVGYILLGKDSISTSLKIRGKLDNPEVTTQVAKDIMVAPLNILKRTLMLPFELFKSGDDKKE